LVNFQIFLKFRIGILGWLNDKPNVTFILKQLYELQLLQLQFQFLLFQILLLSDCHLWWRMSFGDRIFSCTFTAVAIVCQRQKFSPITARSLVDWI
jgi:hypothetical protein